MQKENGDKEAATGVGVAESADLSSLTSVAIKNKLDALRKKGKCLIEKLVQPLLKDRPLSGSAADKAPPSSDSMSSIDWEDMNRISRCWDSESDNAGLTSQLPPCSSSSATPASIRPFFEMRMKLTLVFLITAAIT